MAKTKSYFECSSCGNTEPKWTGRCAECGSWNTFTEITAMPASSGKNSTASSKPARSVKAVSLSEVDTSKTDRTVSTMNEFDRVLGGGLVPGSGVIIGGEPGIGKSTLMLQTAELFSKKEKVLYVSGEESAAQIKSRADRLAVSGKNINILSESNLETIISEIRRLRPSIIIIDSIQTMISSEAGSVPGTPNQIKFCTHDLLNSASAYNSSVFFTAHVTKEGVIAGPKTAEHMVDTVVYFEQADNDIRILRAAKNRFGSVDEIGLFRMNEKGLIPVDNPATLFLHRRSTELPPGTSAALTAEGSRSFPVEIQALTVSAQSSISRTFSDRIDSKRISRIAAVLEKHLGLCFSSQDIYIKVAGGLKISEVASDLAIAAALYSARTGLAVPQFTAFAGEISLAGELMPIAFLQKRVKAAAESGFKTIYIPEQNSEEIKMPAGVKLVRKGSVKHIIQQLFVPQKKAATVK